MARPTPRRAPANGFDVLDEESLDSRPLSPRERVDASCSARGVLASLSIEHTGNTVGSPREKPSNAGQLVAAQPAAASHSPKTASRGSHRRPTIDSDTFEPVASLVENSRQLSGLKGSLLSSHTILEPAILHDARLLQEPFATNENNHPLTSAKVNPNTAAQIEKQLAGQFEWLISCPAPAFSTVDHTGESLGVHCPRANLIYGCNLLRRKSAPTSTSNSHRVSETDAFTFIATPLKIDAEGILAPSHFNVLKQEGKMALSQNQPTLCTPTKAAMVEVVEQMLSPPLTIASDRSASLVDAYSPVGSAGSSPRIEDSLAEIDKLEDELEAVGLYGQSRNDASAHYRDSDVQTKAVKTPTSAKRVTIAVQPASVRVRSSDKASPSLRRSSSVTFTNPKKEALEAIPEQKVPGTLARSRSTILRPSTTLSKATAKSTKAPTIPNFELPGEAVSRRLKEQREARQAQQAEAQKAQATLPKARSQKPLARPTFELPGEAISRRKREQHEAKLRAQEEEEKRRREFKARPIRYSIGPSTLPRETITSRARQNKDSVGASRDSLFEANTAPTPGRASHTLPRGRASAVLSHDADSRATSASVGSASGRRSTLSLEDAVQQRLRGREIFVRDNSFSVNKEKAKREKESAAQVARAEAAERSRAASREWAEKRRRKELSLRQAMRESLQPDVVGST